MIEMIEAPTCHDCGVTEGELHQPGCDMEDCPFCGGQLISCMCSYKKLGLYSQKLYAKETGYLSRDAFEWGLSPEQESRWLDILNIKGRVPFIEYPTFCSKCGELWPNLFSVPDEEWDHYIQPDKRKEVLCWTCYTYIKCLIKHNALEGNPISRLGQSGERGVGG